MAIRDVGIIDYGMGNLRSVANACVYLGAQARLIDRPEHLRTCSHLILPGVGAFGDGMANLRQRGLVEPLLECLREARQPFLGICLGMQLLAARGLEFGDHQGIGWLKGTAVKLRNPQNAPGFRLPHIGWNEVELRPDSALAKALPNRPCFYFAHSYVLALENEDHVVAWCQQGERFPAIYESEQVLAAQFHPEKSQQDGLNLLWYFLAKGD